MKNRIKEALNLWTNKEYEKSEILYRDIIATIDKTDERVPFELYQQLAGTLAAQNKDEQALQIHQFVMDKYAENQEISAVQFAMISYFLSKQLYKMKQYNKVLEHTELALASSSVCDNLLLMLKALVLFKLGKTAMSHNVAHQALNTTSNMQQKESIIQQFQDETGIFLESTGNQG